MSHILGFAERTALYLDAARQIRTAELEIESEPERLIVIAEILRKLASCPHAFPSSAFPIAPSSVGGLYRLVEFPDQVASLYMSAGVTGRKANPHTHATWAAVAGVSGVEHNVLYDRVDPGDIDGEGKLRLRSEHHAGPGDVVVLPSGVFHTIEVTSDTATLHLHAYGRSVDAPSPPLPAFDAPESRTYKLRQPGGFAPAVPVVPWEEAVAASSAGKAALLSVDHLSPADGALAIHAETDQATEAIAALGSPVDYPVLLNTDGNTASALAPILHHKGWPMVFRIQAQGQDLG